MLLPIIFLSIHNINIFIVAFLKLFMHTLLERVTLIYMVKFIMGVPPDHS